VTLRFPQLESALNLHRNKQLEQALGGYRSAILAVSSLEPNEWDALLAVCHEQPELAKDNAQLLFELGRLLVIQSRVEEALPLLREAVELNPDQAQAALYLGRSLAERGEAYEARQYLQWVFLRTLLDGLRIRRLLTLPLVYDDAASLADWRERFTVELSELATQELKVANPLTEIAVAPHELVFQGEPDRQLMSDLGDLLSQAIAPLSAAAPGPRSGRPVVAVVSRTLHTPHTIRRVFGRWLAALTPADYDVVECPVIEAEAPAPPPPLNPAHRVYPLPAQQWELACQALQRLQPDILLYLDLGAEPVTYFLALQRLAPVQVTTWGHPVTSGLPHIDYYLSSRWIEPEGEAAQAQYRERLVLLEEIPMRFEPEPVEAGRFTRDLFGFSADHHLYVCPQRIQKFHPAFDAILVDLLRQDPQGWLVMFSSGIPSLDQKLIARWERVAADTPQLLDRIALLQPMSRPDFLALLALCDVMLDPPAFGGGCTSMEALSIGLPIVTLEGPLMRQRMTSGMLRRMGVLETLAADLEDYVTQAIRLATDRPAQQALRQRLREHAPCVLDNPSTVQELDAFLTQQLRQLGRLSH
jgi:predicted O-linked N-acetylglucosamine transferase (SPINDLY family)